MGTDQSKAVKVHDNVRITVDGGILGNYKASGEREREIAFERYQQKNLNNVPTLNIINNGRVEGWSFSNIQINIGNDEKDGDQSRLFMQLYNDTEHWLQLPPSVNQNEYTDFLRWDMRDVDVNNGNDAKYPSDIYKLKTNNPIGLVYVGSQTTIETKNYSGTTNFPSGDLNDQHEDFVSGGTYPQSSNPGFDIMWNDESVVNSSFFNVFPNLKVPHSDPSVKLYSIDKR